MRSLALLVLIGCARTIDPIEGPEPIQEASPPITVDSASPSEPECSDAGGPDDGKDRVCIDVTTPDGTCIQVVVDTLMCDGHGLDCTPCDGVCGQ